MSDLVIIGGGHAAAHLCGTLNAEGFRGTIELVCEEADLPYHRPPLSKTFLKLATEPLQPHRMEAWYEAAGITTHLGDAAVSIHRQQQAVVLASGKRLTYSHLVLATGARATIPQSIAQPLPNVCTLRTADDALRLRALLSSTERVAVLGGGFTGLEIASSALALRKRVTVFEAAERLLARSVSLEIASQLLSIHRHQGIDIRLSAQVEDFLVEGNRLVAIMVDGAREEIDLLVVGIGARPETRLADQAGLACDNGIQVDALMRTTDASILAIGDCVNYPEHGSARRLRLESVQSATEQARTAAGTILGREEPHRAVPSFWSDQGPARLQVVGLMPARDAHGLVKLVRLGLSAGSLSILYLVDSRLVCVESLNAPADHLAAKKLIGLGVRLPIESLTDASVPLKSYLSLASSP